MPVSGNMMDELYGELTSEALISITYANNLYRTVFTAGRIRSLGFSAPLINPAAFFNMRSEMYMRERLPARQGVLIRTDIWENSRHGFGRLFRELEKAAATENDPRYEAVHERYTTLPEDLPVYIHELTAQITADSDSPYEKVMAIAAWLNENCDYSLEPEIVPAGEDFVEYFLKTGVGYCTYYATALAVMARCEGIPSRYITGFALEERESGARYIATGETAHAWTEIYFKGIGWMEIDPLKWNPASPLNRRVVEEESDEVPELPAVVTETPDSETDGPVEDIDDTTALRDRNVFRFIVISTAVLIVLIVLSYFAVRVLLRRKERQFALGRILIRRSDNYQRLEIYYKDILKQLALLDLSPMPGETLVTFPERTDAKLVLDGVSFSSIAKRVSNHHFAGIAPEQEHVEEAYRYHRLLEVHLFEILGKWVYLIRRAVR